MIIDMTKKDTYTINELISKFENVREDVRDEIDLMKAFHTLAKEIGKMQFYQKCLMDILPENFRMLNPDKWNAPKKKKVQGKWIADDLFED